MLKIFLLTNNLNIIWFEDRVPHISPPTSTIPVTQVGEPPDVAEPHGEAEAGEQELHGVVPLPALLGVEGVRVPRLRVRVALVPRPGTVPRARVRQADAAAAHILQHTIFLETRIFSIEKNIFIVKEIFLRREIFYWFEEIESMFLETRNIFGI